MKNNLNETAKRNIVRMKQHEGGNVHFANKVGISTGKASQLTSSDTAISSAVLSLICDCYKINEGDLFSKQWKPIQPDNILHDKYYGYFFTTWAKTKPKIDIAEITIGDGQKTEFVINDKKKFNGIITIGNNFINSEMQFLDSRSDTPYQAMFVLPRDPNLKSPKKYYGGLGLLMLPTDSELVPVAQRFLISCVPLCIEENNVDNEFVRKSLLLGCDDYCAKVEVSDDREVFYYLRGKING